MAEASKFWRLSGTTQDLTFLPGEGGIHVIDAVYQRLRSTCAFEVDLNYLNSSAYRQTKFGMNYAPGSGGIWQVKKSKKMFVRFYLFSFFFKFFIEVIKMSIGVKSAERSRWTKMILKRILIFGLIWGNGPSGGSPSGFF